MRIPENHVVGDSGHVAEHNALAGAVNDIPGSVAAALAADDTVQAAAAAAVAAQPTGFIKAHPAEAGYKVQVVRTGVTVSGGAGEATVTYPYAFPSGTAGVFITRESESTPKFTDVVPLSKSATGFRIRCRNLDGTNQADGSFVALQYVAIGT